LPPRPTDRLDACDLADRADDHQRVGIAVPRGEHGDHVAESFDAVGVVGVDVDERLLGLRGEAAGIEHDDEEPRESARGAEV
jgi:hypothetical protein